MFISFYKYSFYIDRNKGSPNINNLTIEEISESRFLPEEKESSFTRIRKQSNLVNCESKIYDIESNGIQQDQFPIVLESKKIPYSIL